MGGLSFPKESLLRTVVLEMASRLLREQRPVEYVPVCEFVMQMQDYFSFNIHIISVCVWGWVHLLRSGGSTFVAIISGGNFLNNFLYMCLIVLAN